MDLNITLWIGGTLFSLGIFAVKVGFGLGFGRASWKGIILTLSMYLVLFVLIAALSEPLMKILEPVLRKGPYLHVLMAIGMIGWGMYLVLKSGRAEGHQVTVKQDYTATKQDSRFKIQNSRFKIQDLKLKNENSINSSLVTRHSLLLLIPCPVCLSAMTFSTWAALGVIKLPPIIVGLGLGIVFIVLSFGVYFFLKLASHQQSPITQRIRLGLSMIAIGLYFIASLYIPAKIEEAKAIYQSFITDGSNIDINQYIGVLALFSIALIIGYLTNKKKEG